MFYLAGVGLAFFLNMLLISKRQKTRLHVLYPNLLVAETIIGKMTAVQGSRRYQTQ